MGSLENKALWRKRIRRLIIGICSFALCILLLLPGLNAWVLHKTRSAILSAEQAAALENVDCILVLGCLVHENGKLSEMLQERMYCGISLYQAGVSTRMLLSGDHGRKDYDEVNSMKEYALQKGIPSEVIFMDHAGFSTYESMYRAAKVFGVRKLVIVSQEYHLSRAIYSARALGMEAYGVASDSRVYPGQQLREIREVLARVKDVFYCLFDIHPKYLGEHIDIHGSGDVTNDK